MKPVPRSPWITIHRYLGLLAIPFLFLAALTGVILCFAHPLDLALNADLFRQPVPLASPPPVAPLMDRFVRLHPEWQVRSFPLAVAGTDRIPVTVERAPGSHGAPVDQIFLDRGTGHVAASRSSAAAFTRRGFAEWLLELHRNLLLGTFGRIFLGAIAVAWLIGHLIGFYLTFPLKGPFWKGWKRSWKVSMRSMFAKLMLDWHKASALWLFVPLTALAITSAGLNFFTEAWAPMVETLFAQPQAPPHSAPPRHDQPLDFVGAVAAAKRQAARHNPEWQPATVLNDPQTGTIGVTMTDDGTLNYHRLGPIYYHFDKSSHALVEEDDPYHGNNRLAGYRVLYPLHSGRVGGNLTILLIALSGLATMGLCVTGGYVWWKKRQSRVAMRRAQAARKATGRVGRGRQN